MSTRYVPPMNELEQIAKPKGARSNWGYCGIAAISAASGVPPLKVLELMPEWKGLTPSKLLINTLQKLGFIVMRENVPREIQRYWPGWATMCAVEAVIARLYWGPGKYSASHWIVFHEENKEVFLYDNQRVKDEWVNVEYVPFYPAPSMLKSKYYLLKRRD